MACVGESTVPMGLIYVWYFLLLLRMLSFQGLLLLSGAYNKTGKRLDDDKHFTKSGHALSPIRTDGMFITDTHT